MEKQKIIDMVERHTSVDSARKELVNLKTLLNTTECKISQYQVESNNLERFIEEDEEKLAQKKQEVLEMAEDLIKSMNAADKEWQDSKRKEGEGRIKQINELIKSAHTHIEQTENQLKENDTKMEVYVQETEKALEELKNKTNYFNKKKIKKQIQDAEALLNKEKESFEKIKESTTDSIAEFNSKIEDLEQEKKKTAAEYAWKIADIAKTNADRKESFEKQKEIFNQINSDTDLSKLIYFNQDSLKDIVTLITKISNAKAKKQETLALLEQSKAEKEDIVNNMNLLNDKIDTVLKEREELKEKIATTKETVENNVKGKISTMKTMITSALNCDEEEMEDENTQVENRTSSNLEKIIKATNEACYNLGKTEEIMKETLEKRNAVNEKVESILETFDFKSIIEENKEEGQKLLSDLADKIVEDYANQKQEDMPTLGNAINKAVKFFGKRKK